MTSPRNVWFSFLGLTLLWGSSYLFIRIGVRQLTPLALVSLRLLFAVAGVAALAAVTRMELRLPPGKALPLVVLATFNITVPFLLITWGEVVVPSGLSAVLVGTTPIFSTLIAAAVLHDEPLTAERVLGVLIGFGGLVVLASRDIQHGALQWSTLAGQMAIMGAGLSYAVSAVLARRTLQGVASRAITFYTVGIAAAEVTTLSLIFSPPPITSLRPESLLAVVWLGLLCSALAYVLHYTVIAGWGAGRATFITYTTPVVGLILGAVILHEVLDGRILLGSALVVAGVLLASLLGARRAARARAAERRVAVGTGAE